MKRRIFATLLAFCLIASLCVVGAAARGPISEGTAYDNCEEPCNHVAAIGSTHYDDLEYAITQADDDDTIDILRDVTDGRGVVVSSEKNITIDFHGFTYTVTRDPAGSTDTQHQCFQLLRDSTITMKNGTIVANEPTINIIVQNYSNLTLDGMTLDASVGTNSLRGSYVLSNNFGDVVITGNTNITANNGFAFDAYYWPDGGYGEGVTVTLDEEFTGTINGNVEVTRDGTSTSSGNSSLIIEAGTINGDISHSSNGSVSISNATVNGDITNSSKVGGELVVDDVTVTGTIANTGTSASTTVMRSRVSEQVEGAVVIDSMVAGVPTNTAPEGVVAVIGTKQYTDLEDALEEAGTGPVTIELVADAPIETISTDFVKVTRDTTINGNGHTITITASGYTSSRTKILQFIGADVVLNDVTLNIIGSADGDGSYSGDAIDLYEGANLKVINSRININDVAAAFVMQTEGEVLNLDSTIVNVNNVDGNGSQGGEWNIANNSVVTFADCLNHALSTQTLTVNDSVVDINGCGLFGIFGAQIDINSGSEVTVTNCGKNLPNPTGSAAPGYGYISPVQIKASNDSYLKVDSNAVLNVTGNVSTEGPNDTIFFPENAELINNGTINATVTVPEDSDMCVVVFMADGAQYDVQVVDSGDSVRVPTLSKNGYTFVGWRVNNSNTIVKGGESYPITANTTFTAVWNMINVPDTYEISVISSDGGTVEASLSNASAGSVITLTVTPDEGYELAYITVDGERISGTSFVMPDHSVEVRAVFTEIGAEMNFVDVSRSDWFYDAVEYVYTNGLMEGTSTRTFEPNATMTRAMFWTVLARIDGETITGDNWKTLAQNWAVSSGISDGTNADGLITREQMVTMLYRFANSPEVAATGFGQFTDGASVSDWAVDAMAWALNNGVITGMGDGILSPAGSATRAQAAAMLMRFVEA
mgnify:CR=1 FL=1